MRSTRLCLAVLMGAMLAHGCDLVFVLEPPPAGPSVDSGVPTCAGQDDRVDINVNGTADCLENLLAYGQFGTDVAHWTDTPSATVRWSNLDARGSQPPGSALVENIVPMTMANGGNVLSPCIPIAAPANYGFYTDYWMDAGQPGGDAGAWIAIVLFTYKDRDCTLPGSSTLGFMKGTTKNAWAPYSQPYAIDAGAGMIIGLMVVKGATTSPVTARFDNVLVVRE